MVSKVSNICLRAAVTALLPFNLVFANNPAHKCRKDLLSIDRLILKNVSKVSVAGLYTYMHEETSVEKIIT